MNDSTTARDLEDAQSIIEELKISIKRIIRVTAICGAALPDANAIWEMKQIVRDRNASEEELRELAIELLRAVERANDARAILLKLLNLEATMYE